VLEFYQGIGWSVLLICGPASGDLSPSKRAAFLVASDPMKYSSELSTYFILTGSIAGVFMFGFVQSDLRGALASGGMQC